MKLILVAVACMLPILGAAAVPQAQTPATPPQTQTKPQAAPPTQTKPQTKTAAPAATQAATPKPIPGANLVNPVKPTKASLATGKLHYSWDCAMCHGDNGQGNGSLAKSENLSSSDFTNPATLQNLTDGQIFTVIRTGAGKKMPPEGKARANDTVVWDLVNYLRSLSKPGATPAS